MNAPEMTGQLHDRLLGVLAQSKIKETVRLITGGNLALEDKR